MTGEESNYAQRKTVGSQRTRDGSQPKEEGSKAATQRLARIRELNDRLRITGKGGMVHMTLGVAALGLATVNTIFAAVAEFADFSSDNDPWSEHDCGTLTVLNHRIMWKIDYYDRSRRFHSPDPADPKVTVRVMTVMLASEY
jgi:Protein of unknown function (DUF3768)